MASSLLRPLILSAALTTGLIGSACSSTHQSVGIESVDGLATRVERVHLETELSKEAVYRSIICMSELFRPQFDGDPSEVFEAFVTSTEECQKRANTLRGHIVPMRNSADDVFANRATNVEAIASESMRARAQARLDSAEGRYQRVEDAANNAQTKLDALIVRLRDMALFLGHDFNEEAVESVRQDAFSIRDEARALSIVLDRCMDAAAIYVRDTAILGQTPAEIEAETAVEETGAEEQGEPTEETPRSKEAPADPFK